jgi:predicted dehydrogenase
MDDRIRIGLIGAAANRGWARVSHVPAIAATPAFILQAIATTNPASADEAAAAFGAPLAFGDPRQMIDCDEVDAISVAVKAPAHYALVRRALERGKPVYCEWPLGASLSEAQELAELANARGSITMIGFQGRSSPWVEQVREYIKRGGVGKVLSTTLVADDDFSVGTIEQGNAYMLDVSNGANALTIHGGHFLDTLCYVLGEWTSLSADLAVSRPSVLIRESGECVSSTSPDNIAVTGLLVGGAVASVHIRPGTVGQPSMRWEIQGERGALRVTSDGYMHWRPLILETWEGSTSSWRRLTAPIIASLPSDLAPANTSAQNVTYHFRAFGRSILNGTPSNATFFDALRRHLTIQGVAEASRSGQRQYFAD